MTSPLSAAFDITWSLATHVASRCPPQHAPLEHARRYDNTLFNDSTSRINLKLRDAMSTTQWNSIEGDSRSDASPLLSGNKLLATTGRLHLHFSVDFNGWRQQVVYISTFQWNSIDGDSRSHTSPLFNGIQWMATACRTRRNSIVGDCRSPSPPLFSGL